MEAYCCHDIRRANPFNDDFDEGIRGIGGIESSILAPISISVKNVLGITCAEDLKLIKRPYNSGFFIATFPSIEKIMFKGSNFDEYLYPENLAQYKEDLSAHEIYESLRGDPGNIELSEAGTVEFFKLMNQPNAYRDKMIEESKDKLSEEQKLNLGKSRVYFNFKLKSKRGG